MLTLESKIKVVIHVPLSFLERSLPKFVELRHDFFRGVLRIESPEIVLRQTPTEPRESQRIEPAEGQAAREPRRAFRTLVLTYETDTEN